MDVRDSDNGFAASVPRDILGHPRRLDGCILKPLMSPSSPCQVFTSISFLVSVNLENQTVEEEMARTRWLCAKNSTKNVPVKIVHPGGHVELHDRLIVAAKIRLHDPRCCVAYPHVFQQPWTIVAPDTTLMLGQKFYVVPISTVWKLQRLTLRCSPLASPSSASPSSASPSPSLIYDFITRQTPRNEGSEHDSIATCWSFPNKRTHACIKMSDELSEGQKTGPISSDWKRVQRENDGEECFSKDNCFAYLLAGMNNTAYSGNQGNASRTDRNLHPSVTRELRRLNGSGCTSRRAVGGASQEENVFWKLATRST